VIGKEASNNVVNFTLICLQDWGPGTKMLVYIVKKINTFCNSSFKISLHEIYLQLYYFPIFVVRILTDFS
jgi:hypothetical protein